MAGTIQVLYSTSQGTADISHDCHDFIVYVLQVCHSIFDAVSAHYMVFRYSKVQALVILHNTGIV